MPQIPNDIPIKEENIRKDEKSESEERFLSDDDYKRIQTKRRSDFKKQVHYASIVGIWLGFLFYVIAVFTWLYHLLSPTDYQFMPMENIGTLQNLLFGTIVGGLISQLARKIFSE